MDNASNKGPLGTELTLLEPRTIIKSVSVGNTIGVKWIEGSTTSATIALVCTGIEGLDKPDKQDVPDVPKELDELETPKTPEVAAELDILEMVAEPDILEVAAEPYISEVLVECNKCNVPNVLADPCHDGHYASV